MGGWIHYEYGDVWCEILPSLTSWGPLSEWSTASSAERRPAGRIKVMSRCQADFVSNASRDRGVMPSQHTARTVERCRGSINGQWLLCLTGYVYNVLSGM